jgi:hypothetical protein
MFCTNCGNEVEQVARFCSKCGREVTAATVQTAQKQPHDIGMHINILGWLFVGCGILFGLLGFMMIFAGQLLQRLPLIAPVPPDFPVPMAHFAGWVAGVIGLFVIAMGGGVAAAGVGLLQYKSWGRVLAIIMAILMLFKFPIGTAVGIYALWVLFSHEGQEYYRARAASTMA